jgi:DNA repair protein RecN (Recombination protein N)
MIKQLRIINFILTEDLTLYFGDNLNILTGETGAGKSVIIGALDYLLGRQVRTELAYDRDRPVLIEAIFDLNFKQISNDQQNNTTNRIQILNEILGADLLKDTDHLIISKEISTKGKPISSVNGKRINQSQLLQIRNVLIDFHSQREQLKLFDEQYQLQVIDAWANLGEVREEYFNIYNEIKILKEKKRSLELKEKQLEEKFLLYEYQIEELEGMNMTIDEEAALNSELDLLANSEELLAVCSQIQHSISEQDNSLMDIISNFKQRIQRTGAENNTIRNIITILNEMINSCRDLISETRILESNIDLDETKMKHLEERLNSILRVKSKYKMSIADVLSYLEEMKKTIADKSSRKDEIEKLTKILEEKIDRLLLLADHLSAKRKEAAKPFAESIINDLTTLAIPDGIFYVDISSIGKIFIKQEILGGLNEYGNDKIDFQFSANKGNEAQSLKEVVSGGELSRLLLIIKKILAGRFACPTLILDEIDTGIGGKTANNIGQYIADISNNHQVICITHLPQIASFGEKQFLITKNSLINERKDEIKKPVIQVSELTYEDRKNEIARMLSGSSSQIALQHAIELLENNKGRF